MNRDLDPVHYQGLIQDFFTGEGDLIVISYSGFSIVFLLVERKGNIRYIIHNCLQMDRSTCGKS